MVRLRGGKITGSIGVGRVGVLWREWCKEAGVKDNGVRG